MSNPSTAVELPPVAAAAVPLSPQQVPQQRLLDVLPTSPAPARPRLDWAALLRRTWGFDVFDCPCGGRRRVLALIRSPALARKLLGLPARARPPALPTGPPQLSLLLH